MRISCAQEIRITHYLSPAIPCAFRRPVFVEAAVEVEAFEDEFYGGCYGGGVALGVQLVHGVAHPFEVGCLVDVLHGGHGVGYVEGEAVVEASHHIIELTHGEAAVPGGQHGP